MTITVSAPGKIHFLGEHAVVHGKPALLAAINKRCVVSLASRKDWHIEIISRNFQKRILLSQKQISERTHAAQRAWNRFIKDGDIAILSSITKEELDYATIAIGESLALCSAGAQRGFTLTIDSEIPVGSGLGSSAAVAVSIAAAVSLFLNGKVDKQVIYDIAFSIEQKKHGRPSGGDPATVLHGGLVWFRKETGDLKIIQPIPFAIPKNIAKNFYLIDTGKPKESTGEMVAHVKKQFDVNSVKVGNIFNDQERLTRDLLGAIKKNDNTLMIYIIKAGQKNLEKLGVVSPFVQKLVRVIERSVGAAKISGGGGKTKGTGMVLVYHEDRKKLERVIQSYKLSLFNVKLGVEGMHVI